MRRRELTQASHRKFVFSDHGSTSISVRAGKHYRALIQPPDSTTPAPDASAPVEQRVPAAEFRSLHFRTPSVTARRTARPMLVPTFLSPRDWSQRRASGTILRTIATLVTRRVVHSTSLRRTASARLT